MHPARSLTDLLADDGFVVAGANSGGDMVAAWLRSRGKHVRAFADLDPLRTGPARQGLPVLPVHEAAGGPLIVGSYRLDLYREAWDAFGGDPARLYPFVNAMFAPHFDPSWFAAHAVKLAEVRRHLSDAASVRVFDGILAFYGGMDLGSLVRNPRAYGPYGYAAPGLRPAAGDTIADIGAYDGDTCAFYLGEEPDLNIHAFEAHAPNASALRRRIRREGWQTRVTVHELAIGREPGTALFGGTADADPTAGLGGGMSKVPVETLDRIFQNGPRLSLVKCDIEGGDLDALEGAAQVIARDRPLLAFAAYHDKEHFWRLPYRALELLWPARLYAAHDPQWLQHLHYIVVPERR
jgi:FkbM family methyltransferase